MQNAIYKYLREKAKNVKFDVKNMINLKDVEFSRNDIRKKIKIPSKLSNDLAYETGVHAGDGYLGIFQRKDGPAYWVVYSGNLTEEYEYYSKIILPLINKLYNKKCTIKKCSKNTLRVDLKSKAIATFKHRVIKLPNGPKTGTLRIPNIIKSANTKIKSSFLSGLVDTDFSLVFVKNGKYPKITTSFPVQNKEFVKDVIKLFNDIGIKANANLYNCKDVRYTPTKLYKAYKIDINGKRNLYKWLDVAGFRSPKHVARLAIWEKFGEYRKRTI
ncbi:hypothetical protein GF374_00030 [Candidatus Woesearchaeota archaeon]|nr:hypothetical protein [Candidatus Woesearchaeota archaeon]